MCTNLWFNQKIITGSNSIKMFLRNNECFTIILTAVFSSCMGIRQFNEEKTCGRFEDSLIKIRRILDDYDPGSQECTQRITQLKRENRRQAEAIQRMKNSHLSTIENLQRTISSLKETMRLSYDASNKTKQPNSHLRNQTYSYNDVVNYDDTNNRSKLHSRIFTNSSDQEIKSLVVNVDDTTESAFNFNFNNLSSTTQFVSHNKETITGNFTNDMMSPSGKENVTNDNSEDTSSRSYNTKIPDGNQEKNRENQTEENTESPSVQYTDSKKYHTMKPTGENYATDVDSHSNETTDNWQVIEVDSLDDALTNDTHVIHQSLNNSSNMTEIVNMNYSQRKAPDNNSGKIDEATVNNSSSHSRNNPAEENVLNSTYITQSNHHSLQNITSDYQNSLSNDYIGQQYDGNDTGFADTHLIRNNGHTDTTNDQITRETTTSYFTPQDDSLTRLPASAREMTTSLTGFRPESTENDRINTTMYPTYITTNHYLNKFDNLTNESDTKKDAEHNRTTHHGDTFREDGHSVDNHNLTHQILKPNNSKQNITDEETSHFDAEKIGVDYTNDEHAGDKIRKQSDRLEQSLNNRNPNLTNYTYPHNSSKDYAKYDDGENNMTTENNSTLITSRVIYHNDSHSDMSPKLH